MRSTVLSTALVTVLGASAAAAASVLGGPNRNLPARDTSSSSSQSGDDLTAVMSPLSGDSILVNNDTSSLTPLSSNTTITEDTSSTTLPNGDIVVITIGTQVGPMPEDEILIGFLAAEALLYSGGSRYPPTGQMSSGGVSIFFKAGPSHAIDLHSAGPRRATWALVGAVLKQAGNRVFQLHINREFSFTAKVNNVPVMNGFVHDEKKSAAAAVTTAVATS